MTPPHGTTLKQFDDALGRPDDTCYQLTLFVSGASDLSASAISNARQLCDTYLDGRYRLSVVDLREKPAAVVSVQVIAAPTLVRNWPLPVRKLVGDLSDTDKVLQALGLPSANDPVPDHRG